MVMRSFIRLFVLVLLVALILLSGTVPSASGPRLRNMPANEVKLMQSLLARQGLTLAEDGAKKDAKTVTYAEASAMLQGYLRQKLGKKPEDRPNFMASRILKQAEEAGVPANLKHGKKLGRSQVIPGSEPGPYEGEVALDKILLILVEFSDPAHNAMPKPGPENNIDYWVPDFNTAHYQDMLFGKAPGAKTMANYYLEQSYGQYTVDGVAYGWVKLNVPESEYGADSASGNDNAHGPVWRVVRDAVTAFGNAVPWTEYDQEDPYDLDGDGDPFEPDGYVDHVMFVHAGAGQEGGGGAQGDDAIWSHSSWADFGSDAGPLGGVPTSDSDVLVGPYTIMPEDGAIGVFCHEFAHDLGLPDEYDTIYSGESSPAFWSLMASGSWLGKPLGTCPSSISIWGRYALGWTNPAVVNLGQDSQILLDRAEMLGSNAPAIRISLPKKKVLFSINAPYSGGYEWYSGSGDGLNQRLTREVDLSAAGSAILTFAAWYEIEQDWDYGYVEVSADNGLTWTRLPGNLTTTTDPNGNNDGNGITGSSGGWVQGSFDLSAFAGQRIKLRFRYATDGAVSLKGWAIDDIAVSAVGFFDNVETGVNSWQASGWQIFAGQEIREYTHYYLLELRDYFGFDESLRYAYNFYGLPDTVQFFPYTPGVLLWYRDFQYGDNWVGEHPGRGFLLVVDSHPTPDRMPRYGDPWRNRIQVRDATFSLDWTLESGSFPTFLHQDLQSGCRPCRNSTTTRPIGIRPSPITARTCRHTACTSGWSANRRTARRC